MRLARFHLRRYLAVIPDSPEHRSTGIFLYTGTTVTNSYHTSARFGAHPVLP